MGKGYRITWEIDIDDDSPIEAAKQALSIMRDRHSTATFFKVVDGESGEVTDVDLEDEAIGTIRYIKKVIGEYGSTSTYEMESDFSPCISSIGENSVMVERFYDDGVETVTYVGGLDVYENYIPYEELSNEVLDEIRILIEQYEAEQLKTQKRIED